MKYYIAFAMGLILGFLLLQGYFLYTHSNVKAAAETNYHTHSDWLVVVEDSILDLSADTYHSRAGHTLHDDVHLHDTNDDIIHFHAPNISFATFVESLDFKLTQNCFSTSSTTVCNSNEQKVAVFVNGEERTDYMDYIPTDEDRILLYAGPRDTAALDNYLSAITDEACIYSGNCPERGTAPPEACGLTCEL